MLPGANGVNSKEKEEVVSSMLSTSTLPRFSVHSSRFGHLVGFCMLTVVAITIIELLLVLILKIAQGDIFPVLEGHHCNASIRVFQFSALIVASFILEDKDILKGKGMSCNYYMP